MKTRTLVVTMALVVGVGFSGPASADTISVSALDSGWYDEGGLNHPDNLNYAVGYSGEPNPDARDFFVFDLGSVTGTVIGATLRAYNPSKAEGYGGDGFVSTSATETLGLFEVSTAIADLRAGVMNPSAIYQDLGTGTLFGERTVSVADNGTFVDTVLNSNALAAINAALGNEWAIGGALLRGDPSAYLFAYSYQKDFVPQHIAPALILETSAVPLPPAVLLLASGLAAFGFMRQRRLH
jgi:hypothetical protein